MIPTKAPDVEAWLINGLSNVEQTFNVKPEKSAPYRMLTVLASLGAKVTPISRYCQVTVQAWSVRSDGSANLADAFDLAAAAGNWLESNLTGPVLSADVQAGPFRLVDPVARIETQTMTVLLEVSV
jgi:hypothetical protein